MRKHSSYKDGMDGTDVTDVTDGLDGLDGALLGLVWDGWLLAPAGTGVAEQERHHCLAGYCKQVMNGIDGLDVSLVGQGQDGRTLAGSGMVALPWEKRTGASLLALEGQRAMRSGSWHQFRRCGVFVSEKLNNTNRVHINPNL